MLNTLIYILHSTEHRFFFKRACDQKLCLIHNQDCFKKISSYTEPLLLYALFYKYVNVTATFAQVHSDAFTSH